MGVAATFIWLAWALWLCYFAWRTYMSLYGNTKRERRKAVREARIARRQQENRDWQRQLQMRQMRQIQQMREEAGQEVQPVYNPMQQVSPDMLRRAMQQQMAQSQQTTQQAVASDLLGIPDSRPDISPENERRLQQMYQALQQQRQTSTNADDLFLSVEATDSMRSMEEALRRAYDRPRRPTPAIRPYDREQPETWVRPDDAQMERYFGFDPMQSDSSPNGMRQRVINYMNEAPIKTLTVEDTAREAIAEIRDGETHPDWSVPWRAMVQYMGKENALQAVRLAWAFEEPDEIDQALDMEVELVD